MCRRLLAIFALLSAFALVHPLGAFATTAIPYAAPQSVQTTIDFDSPSQVVTNALTADKVYVFPITPTLVPTVASWGRITAEHQSGSYGLWCAGSIPASWPAYPTDTSGIGAYPVGDTSSYYESWVQFSYKMPSIGLSNNFSATWYNGLKDPTSADPDIVKTQLLSPLWHPITLARQGAHPDIPATAGTIGFQFTRADETIPVGEGPTIDDLMVTGYKYGPVRSITATREAGLTSSVDLTWVKPVAALGSSTQDPRSLTYRVWRHDVGADMWTEVTSTRLTTTSFTDTNVPLTNTYEYLVQAWDTGTGTGYGEQPASMPQLLPANGTRMTASFVSGGGSTQQVVYGANTQLAGTLLNSASSPVTGLQSSVTLQSSPDGVTWNPAASTTESSTSHGTYVATVSPTSAIYYRFVFTAAGGYAGCTGTPVLQVTMLPADTAWSNASVASSTVDYNGSTTMSAKLNLNEPGQTGPVTGQAGHIVVQTSPNGSAWADSGIGVTEPTSGTYSATLSNITPPAYFRFHFTAQSNFNESYSQGLPVATRSSNVQWSSITQNGSTASPHCPYGGAVTIVGTLSNGNGLATGLSTVVGRYSADNGSTWTSGVTATELSPGVYSATVPVTANVYDYPTNPHPRLDLYFPGDGNYTSAQTLVNATVPPITVDPATTSWNNVPTSTVVAAYGGSVGVSADLVSGVNGQAVTGVGSVALQSSTDAGFSSPSNVLGIAESPAGHWAVTLSNVTAHKYYRWVFSNNTPGLDYVTGTFYSASFDVTSTSNPSTTITNSFVATSATAITLPVRAQTALVGALKDAGNSPVSGQAGHVVVQTSPNNSTWTNATASVASSTVESPTASGTYQVTVSANPTEPNTTYYRLAFLGAGAYTASQASTALSITTRAATTSWSGVPSSANPSYGTTTAISGTLNSETGPVTSTSGVVTVQLYNGSWATTSGVSVTNDAPAHYTAALGSAGLYRLHFAGDTNYGASDSSTMTVTVTAASSTWTNGTPGPAPVPYGGSTILTSTLNANSAPLTGKASEITLYNGSSPLGVSITENPGGSGQYTATLSNVTANGSYHFSFAGETGKYATQDSSVIAVTTHPANSVWSAEHESASSVAVNGASTFSATLKSETGAALTGVAGSVHLQQSTTGTSGWTAVSPAPTVTDGGSGSYSAPLPTNNPGTWFYRLHYDGVTNQFAAGDSQALQLDVGKVTTQWTGLSVDHSAFSQPGGAVKLTGTLTDSGSNPIPSAAGEIVLNYSTDDGITWATFATAVQEVAGHPGQYQATYYPVNHDTRLKFVFAGDTTYAAAEGAYPDAITVALVPSFQGEGTVPSVIGYGGGVTLSGSLHDASNTLLTGKTVIVQSSFTGADGTWSQSGTATDVASPGTYTATIGGITELAYYRLYWDNSPDVPAQGATHPVNPYAYVGAISYPGSVKHTKSYTFAETVSLASGLRTVVIKGYHKEKVRVRYKSGSKYRYKTVTKWLLRTTVRKGIPSGGGTYRLSFGLRLSRTGYWYLQSTVSDSYNMQTLSNTKSARSK